MGYTTALVLKTVNESPLLQVFHHELGPCAPVRAPVRTATAASALANADGFNEGTAPFRRRQSARVTAGLSRREVAGAGSSRTYFVEWPSAPDDRTLGVVDFSIFPHLNAFPTNTLAHAERWAADIGGPAYAIDEQTAIQVVDGTVQVVSEGNWKLFSPSR